MTPVTFAVLSLALMAMALVGIGLVRRPRAELERSRERVRDGRALPLESLSHRFLPGLETPRGYAAIGAAMVAAALSLFVFVLIQFVSE